MGYQPALGMGYQPALGMGYQLARGECVRTAQLGIAIGKLSKGLTVTTNVEHISQIDPTLPYYDTVWE
jgi:hypothetical protein